MGTSVRRVPRPAADFKRAKTLNHIILFRPVLLEFGTFIPPPPGSLKLYCRLFRALAFFAYESLLPTSKLSDEITHS